MKVSAILSPIRQTAFAAVIGVNLLIAAKVPAQAIAEVERVIALARTFPQRKRPALTRWTHTVRQTLRS